MLRNITLAAVAAAALGIHAAAAEPVVDGVRDGSYVLKRDLASTVHYSIYTDTGSAGLYFYFQADPGYTPVGSFANLYFDLDPAKNNGSDLGFETTNHRAFIPGSSFYQPTPDIQTAASTDGTGLEVLIPTKYFTAPIGSLTYGAGLVFPTTGDTVSLRISQTFDYDFNSVARPDALAFFVLPAATAVPEPASLSLLLGGLAGLGFIRRRKG